MHPMAQRIFNKVPEVTLLFWIVKIMATTVGETAADFLSVDLHFGLTGTSLFLGSLLLIVLFLQIRSSIYRAWLYWLTVVLISVVGTLITDNLVDNFGLSLVSSTTIFGIALIATFISWYSVEKTLSIHAITTIRREVFYWFAILFTFALGTAAGDLVSEGFHLGYFNAALIYAGLIGAVLTAHHVFKASPVWTFWLAYILTRPFGASCGDLLSQPPANSGLGLGTVGTSAVFFMIISLVVGYWTIAQRKK